MAGNRLTETVNGVTTSRTYNAANQRTDLSYDAAGNLTGDGTTTYAWDALGRLVTQGSTTNAYTGDGVLVQRGSTRYAVDTGSGLSQILSDGTTTVVYGAERLFSVATTRQWLVGDARDSVRTTLDDTGSAASSTDYDPWGAVQSGGTSPFGFTGELQVDGLIYLRARWYHAAHGRFLSVDPWEGEPTRPASLHRYAYTENDPVNYTDPTGMWRWRSTSAGSVPERLLQNVQMDRNLYRIQHVHAEFPIGEYTNPKIHNKKIDVLDSSRGDVYELEPIDAIAKARSDLTTYMGLLKIHGSALKGTYKKPGPRSRKGNFEQRHIGPWGATFDWCATQWKEGSPFGFLPVRIKISEDTDLVAAPVEAGIVLFWLEPHGDDPDRKRARQRVENDPARNQKGIDDKRIIRDKGHRPPGTTGTIPRNVPRGAPVGTAVEHISMGNTTVRSRAGNEAGVRGSGGKIGGGGGLPKRTR